MKKYLNQLTGSLSKIFDWHKLRIDCFSNLLLGQISTQTVHQHKDTRNKRNICNQSVYLSGTRSHVGELLIVVSSSNSIERPMQVRYQS